MRDVAEAPRERVYLDAAGMICGRLASYAAKEAIRGKEVVIVNAEKAVISGTKSRALARLLKKLRTGTLASQEKAPKHPRRPDTYLRRIIRSMLPRKKPKGRDSYRRVKVYIGIPQELSGVKLLSLEEASASRLKCPSVTLKELMREVGSK
ncbi:MAG: 50S ribosomal protein L13 [Candidatus Bathyarchaeia archaeon]